MIELVNYDPLSGVRSRREVLDRNLGSLGLTSVIKALESLQSDKTTSSKGQTNINNDLLYVKIKGERETKESKEEFRKVLPQLEQSTKVIIEGVKDKLEEVINLSPEQAEGVLNGDIKLSTPGGRSFVSFAKPIWEIYKKTNTNILKYGGLPGLLVVLFFNAYILLEILSVTYYGSKVNAALRLSSFLNWVAGYAGEYIFPFLHKGLAKVPNVGIGNVGMITLVTLDKIEPILKALAANASVEPMEQVAAFMDKRIQSDLNKTFKEMIMGDEQKPSDIYSKSLLSVEVMKNESLLDLPKTKSVVKEVKSAFTGMLGYLSRFKFNPKFDGATLKMDTIDPAPLVLDIKSLDLFRQNNGLLPIPLPEGVTLKSIELRRSSRLQAIRDRVNSSQSNKTSILTIDSKKRKRIQVPTIGNIREYRKKPTLSTTTENPYTTSSSRMIPLASTQIPSTSIKQPEMSVTPPPTTTSSIPTPINLTLQQKWDGFKKYFGLDRFSANTLDEKFYDMKEAKFLKKQEREVSKLLDKVNSDLREQVRSRNTLINIPKIRVLEKAREDIIQETKKLEIQAEKVITEFLTQNSMPNETLTKTPFETETTQTDASPTTTEYPARLITDESRTEKKRQRMLERQKDEESLFEGL